MCAMPYRCFCKSPSNTSIPPSHYAKLQEKERFDRCRISRICPPWVQTFLHELKCFHARKDAKLHHTLPSRESAFFLICSGE